MPAQVLRVVYNSLILPHMQYSISAWGVYADRLFKLQNIAMKIITNAHKEPLFKKLNLLQLRDLFTLNNVKLFYKVKTKSLYEYFQEMFPAANPTLYDLRGTSLHQETLVRSGTGKIHQVPSTEHDIQNGYLFAGIMRKALLQRVRWCHQKVFD